MVYRGRLYRRVHTPPSVKSVSQLSGLTTAQDLLNGRMESGGRVQAAVAAADLARNVVEMAAHWRPIIEKERRGHRRRSRIPEIAKDALRKVGIKPPRV